MTYGKFRLIINPVSNIYKGFDKVSYVVQNSSNVENLKLDLLVYGAPKTGKTHAIGQFKSLGFNPLVIACDPGGMLTLKEAGIDFISITSTEEMFRFIGDCNSGKFPFLKHYNMICIDGASNLSYLTLKETGERAKNRQLDYAQAQAPFLKLIDDIRRFPCHVYVNAWEGELKSNGNVYHGATVEGQKLSIKFNGLFNTVFRLFHYYENGETKSAVQTMPDGSHICGGRPNVCNPYEPSLMACVQKMLNLNTGN